jgi:hypothetical protein
MDVPVTDPEIEISEPFVFFAGKLRRLGLGTGHPRCE